MKLKQIEQIIAPPPAHFVGDGFRVHNFIPSTIGLVPNRMDPFIMLDYNSKFKFPPSDQPKGVGVHPHRGFETVTIAYEGKVAHQDSYGGGGIIAEGDVQWMTAASGVLHKESHEEEFSKKGGYFQMVQLWVNLPAKDKMSQPKYQAIANQDISKYTLPDNNGEIEVIAGEYKEIKGAATTFTPLHLLNTKLKSGAIAQFEFPAHYNTALVVISGKITVNERVADTDHFVLFKNEGEVIEIKATEESTVLLMSGEPINEPMVSHGPFVMNTKAEIHQAIVDYQNGAFGELE